MFIKKRSISTLNEIHALILKASVAEKEELAYECNKNIWLDRKSTAGPL